MPINVVALAGLQHQPSHGNRSVTDHQRLDDEMVTIDQKKHEHHGKREKSPDHVVHPTFRIEYVCHGEPEFKPDKLSGGAHAVKNHPRSKSDRQPHHSFLQCQQHQHPHTEIAHICLSGDHGEQHQGQKQAQRHLHLHGHRDVTDHGSSDDQSRASHKRQQEHHQLRDGNLHRSPPQRRDLMEEIHGEPDHDLHHPRQREHRDDGNDDHLRHKRQRDFLD